MNVLLTQLLILQVMLLMLVQPALTRAMAIHLDLQALHLVPEVVLGTGIILPVMGQRLITHGEPENLRKAILSSKRVWNRLSKGSLYFGNPGIGNILASCLFSSLFMFLLCSSD